MMKAPFNSAIKCALILCIPTLLLLGLAVLGLRDDVTRSPLRAIKDGALSVWQANNAPKPPPLVTWSFGDLISELYKPIKLAVTAESYINQQGDRLSNGGRNYWQTSMGKDILIIDIDTRMPSAENDIFNSTKLNWEAIQASGSGLLTISHINHFLYSQIHGYDYKFFHAQKIKGHHNTWVKPHALQQMLSNYKFVVFFDADAIVQHLGVPLEFLFNRWNVSPNTSIALPIDTREIHGDEFDRSTDSKGRIVLNTGVVILQNLPHTHNMMNAWTACTSEKRYHGCGQWRERWSHEQRAFSEYIRYDFNPQGNNIIEIPCNEANGYPGLFGKAGVVDDCKGEFIRHHTLDKKMAKASTADAMMQSVGELLQNNFAVNHLSLLVEDI